MLRVATIKSNSKGRMSESLRRQISSPAALFVFEATARCGSFHGAALELNVTQPSVSYQIKKLEKHLNTRLFERKGRVIALTDDGETLFKSIERGFASIQGGLAEIKHKASGNLVTFCLSSSAAANFFLPRYLRLRDTLPTIEISLKILSRDVNPATENGDFAIRLGYGDWEDLEAWRLFPEIYFPLCSPTYFQHINGPVSLEKLKASNLLYLKERFRSRDDWKTYFEKAGSPIVSRNELFTFSDQQALLASAMEGQGVGLGWLGMADHLLETGSLIKPIDVEIKTDRSFFLVAPRGMRQTRVALSFRDWMIEEGRKIQARWELSRSPNKDDGPAPRQV
jgi:DNA-binding transcriptional LysR family regulator